MFGLIHTKRQMNTSLCLQASETRRGKHITADTAVLLSDLAYQQGTWHRFTCINVPMYARMRMHHNPFTVLFIMQ